MTDEGKYLSPLVSCLECREVKSAKGIFSHFITAHTSKGKERCVQNGKTFSKISQETRKAKKDLKIDEYNLNPTICSICNNPMIYSKRNNKHCSRSCSATYTNEVLKQSGYKVSEEQKLQISKTLLENSPKYSKVNSCTVCGKFHKVIRTEKTCSDECRKKALFDAGQKGGKISNTKRVKRSKDEIKLFNLCLTIDTNSKSNGVLVDGWDTDIFIPSLNLAIMWNGPWHYKEMKLYNHSLVKVQQRDALKMKLFKEHGYDVIVFEDRHYTPQSAFQEILKLVPPGGIEPPLS